MSDELTCELGEVVEIVRGISFPTSAKKRSPARGLIACLRTTNVQDDVDWSDLLFVEEKYVRNERQLIQRGDILVSMSNSLDLVGKCALVGLDHPVATFGTFIAVIRAHSSIDSRYIFSAMRSPAFKAHIREAASTTTNISNINASKLLCAPITLLGKSARQEVVSKVDELFSSIDEGERALVRVRKLVGRYRQSVLKAAVTGELTREWREQHAGELESGEALLTRVLEARRQAWKQSELTKMQAKGTRFAGDSWEKKYQEPVTPETDDSASLPAGWAWATVDQLCGFITSGSRGWKELYSESGSIFIRAQNLKHDVLRLDDVAFVDVSNVTEGLRTKVQKGDLLITITGANVTKSARVQVDMETAYVSQHVALARPVYRELSKFLFQWIISEANGRKQMLGAAYGAGKPGLSLEDVKHVRVALPSESEQRLICEKVDLEMSRLLVVLEAAKAQMASATALRQSVLKSAFSVQLVPQDPTDEPASILLECIAAERVAAPKRASGKQAGAKKRRMQAKA